jgi:hypothetical protein
VGKAVGVLPVSASRSMRAQPQLEEVRVPVERRARVEGRPRAAARRQAAP